MLNNNIPKSRLLQRSKLNKIFGSICKTKTISGGYKIQNQLRLKKPKHRERTNMKATTMIIKMITKKSQKKAVPLKPKAGQGARAQFSRDCNIERYISAIVLHDKCSPVSKNCEPR